MRGSAIEVGAGGAAAVHGGPAAAQGAMGVGGRDPGRGGSFATAGRAQRVAVIGTYTVSLRLFRGRLLEALAARGHRVTAFGPEDDPEVRAYLEGVGCELRTYPLARAGLNPLADRRAMQHLRRELEAIQPDVVLSYTHKAVVYGSLAARDVGVPGIYSMITGLGSAFIGTTWKARAVGIVARALLRRALATNRKVLVYNEDIERAFGRWGMLRDAGQVVRVNGSGVDLEAFPAAPAPDGAVRFLLVGRLLADKGIREYAAAARALRARYPDAQFGLLGPFDTNVTALGRSEVERWHEEGTVTYLGATDDVRPFLREASVLVLPSYAEGIPRSVLEALATARPVITTDAPGCRETVVDGVNGYLVPPRDAKALEEAMARLLDAPERLARMGAESRRIAEERFCVHAVNHVVMRALELA